MSDVSDRCWLAELLAGGEPSACAVGSASAPATKWSLTQWSWRLPRSAPAPGRSGSTGRTRGWRAGCPKRRRGWTRPADSATGSSPPVRQRASPFWPRRPGPTWSRSGRPRSRWPGRSWACAAVRRGHHRSHRHRSHHGGHGRAGRWGGMGVGWVHGAKAVVRIIVLKTQVDNANANSLIGVSEQ